MDDGRREHRPGHRLPAPRRARSPGGGPASAAPRPCGSSPDTSTPTPAIADLAPAERSLVAIARALATRAELIVLDEPTASLPAADCARLFDVLRTLRDRGHGILYVSHRLDEVYEVADTFAVLRDGRLVSQGSLAATAPPAWCATSSATNRPATAPLARPRPPAGAARPS